MNVSSSFSAVDPTSRSMRGSGKLSFGHALLKSVKSIHTLSFPFFFFTTTVLATHSGDIAPLLWIQSLIVCAFRHILPLRAPLRAFFAFVIS